MDFLAFVGIVILSIMGTVCGYVIIHYAPEERKPGENYFKIIAHISVVLFILFLLLTGKLWAIGWAIVFTLTYSFTKYQKHIAYFFCSIGLLLLNGFLLVYGASAFFLYGLTTGALLFNTKKSIKIIIPYCSFGLLPIILSLL